MENDQLKNKESMNISNEDVGNIEDVLKNGITGPPEPIPYPTAGRIVHFHHNQSEQFNLAASNNADHVPAIITQAFDGQMGANMTIFPVGHPPIFGWSVPHKSTVVNGSYWDWPARN